MKTLNGSQIRSSGQAGFTIIEVLMVILIVSILAPVAYVQFIDFRQEAKQALAETLHAAISTGVMLQKSNMLLRCGAPMGAYPAAVDVQENDITNGNSYCTAAMITDPAERNFISGYPGGLPQNPLGNPPSNIVVDCSLTGSCPPPPVVLENRFPFQNVAKYNPNPLNTLMYEAALIKNFVLVLFPQPAYAAAETAPLVTGVPCIGATGNYSNGWCYNSQSGSLWADATIETALAPTTPTTPSTPTPPAPPVPVTFGTPCPANSSCDVSGAQENVPTTASCSTGTITVDSATYGAGLFTQSCLSHAQQACNNQTSCSVNFSNGNCGGDPIYGVYKSGSLKMSCSGTTTAPPNPANDPSLVPVTFGSSPCPAGSNCNVSGALEDVATTASCATGVITVQSATYGSNTATRSCLSYAQTACNNKTSCSITFSNGACEGDPHVGVYKSGSLVMGCAPAVVQ